jgi:hypothetical protein
MIADGMENAEIAAALYIELDSVKSHVRGMFKRLGARSRAHAVGIAYANGLLVVPPQHEHRTARARVALIDFRATRDRAPDDSRFAQLYDRVEQALGP